MVKLWPALHGPNVASFERSNRGQFRMAHQWLGLYGPTVARFVWPSLLWPTL